MACGCAKRRQTVADRNAKREATTSVQRTNISTVHRPFVRMVYYVVAPDGTEVQATTLIEAQQLVRKGGPGYTLRSERPS